MAFPLASCGGPAGTAPGAQRIEDDKNAPDRDNTPSVPVNSAPGKKAFSGEGAVIDYSNAKDGYFMASYKGKFRQAKIQVAFGEPEETYTYDLAPNAGFEAFPLTHGSGKYRIGVFLNIEGDQYMQAAQESISVRLRDRFSPFLRPSQLVDYSKSSAAVEKAAALCKGSKSDLGAVRKMYDFVVKNIKYDKDKARTVKSGYLPDIDETLRTGKGICFDYASLMTAMFRSQRIPTKLVMGYAGKAYHAWIDCYVDGKGWIVKIKFDGAGWYFMDPTFAAGGAHADPNLVGEGDDYNPVYYY